MSIGLIVTRGFGNGTLVGTIKDVVTVGFTIGAPVVALVNFKVLLTTKQISANLTT